MRTDPQRELLRVREGGREERRVGIQRRARSLHERPVLRDPERPDWPRLLGADDHVARWHDEYLRWARTQGSGERRPRRGEPAAAGDVEARVVRMLAAQVAHPVLRLVRHEERVPMHADARGGGPARRERRAVDRRQLAVVTDPENGDRIGALVDGEEQLALRVGHQLLVGVEHARVAQIRRAGAAGRCLLDAERAEIAGAEGEAEDAVRTRLDLVALDEDDARLLHTGAGASTEHRDESRRRRDGSDDHPRTQGSLHLHRDSLFHSERVTTRGRVGTTAHQLWSPAGATGGKRHSPENRSNKRISNPWELTATVSERVVKRGSEALQKARSSAPSRSPTTPRSPPLIPFAMPR